MDTEREICVIGRQGLRGSIAACTLTGEAEHIPVRLEDGEEVMIPANLFVARPDGGYEIPLGREDLARVHNGGGEKVIPLAEERLSTRKELIDEGKVIIKKTVGQHEEIVDLPLLKETVDIERVPVERFATGRVAPWQDGDVLVIPLVEERLFVEKRLVIREELRVRRRQQETHEPRTVVLRKEDVRIERQPENAADAHAPRA